MERRFFPSPGMTREWPQHKLSVVSLLGIAATIFAVLAAVPPRAAHASLERRAPPRPPSVGLEGYSPVALGEKKAWKKGDPAHRVYYQGRVYHFTGANEAATFRANPARYAPVICGCDVVAARDRNRLAEGAREHGLFYQNKVYLFTDERNLQQFQQNPDAYTKFAETNEVRLVRRYSECYPPNVLEDAAEDADNLAENR